MPSTFSTNLKLTLMTTGENSGTWGTLTNTNLGTLIEEAVCGVTTQVQSDGTTTITIADGVTSVARNFVIELTGTITAARNLVVPTIDKPYIIYNNTTGGYAVTVKTAAGTGISVPAGQKRLLYADTTNVVEGITSTGPLTTNGTLAVTGATTLSAALTYGGVNLSNAVTGTGNMVLSASPTFTGSPIAPTQTASDNSTKIATTAYVDTATGSGSLPTATATGTVNVITATYSPVLTLTNLKMCALVSSGENTSTTPTFSPDGLTARTITARGGGSLAPGDIGAAGAVVLLEYNLANTRWELLNPSLSIAANGIFVNSQTVVADYTVASGYNALSAGPITINGGVTVTVTSGSNWAVV